MLSDRVFQRILPLNGRELCPLEDAFTFGIWSMIAYFFNCKEFCEDSGANIIGTFTYFKYKKVLLFQY